MNIEELESKIKYYAEKYYQGVPEVSDEFFDNLIDQLRSIKPDSAVLKTGWGFEVQGNKVKHKYSHIGSLSKCKSYEEIPDRFKTYNVFLSPKLDGLSAVAYYKNGKLTKAITRGNGEYGKDITEKIRLIEGSEIKDKEFTGAVRGELIIHNNNWKILQEKYNDLIAPRNFAAGIINRKEIDEDIKYIDFVVYKVVGKEPEAYPIVNRVDVLSFLTYNFKHAIPRWYFEILNKATWEENFNKKFEEFKTLGYELDGLVLTNYLVPYDNSTHGYIWDEVAFKFQSETAIVKVKSIEWNLTRTQKMIPVIWFEECYLSGAKIQKATGFNAKFILDNEIEEGCFIEICRSGEVIPYVIRRVDL